MYYILPVLYTINKILLSCCASFRSNSATRLSAVSGGGCEGDELREELEPFEEGGPAGGAE